MFQKPSMDPFGVSQSTTEDWTADAPMPDDEPPFQHQQHQPQQPQHQQHQHPPLQHQPPHPQQMYMGYTPMEHQMHNQFMANNIQQPSSSQMPYHGAPPYYPQNAPNQQYHPQQQQLHQLQHQQRQYQQQQQLQQQQQYQPYQQQPQHQPHQQQQFQHYQRLQLEQQQVEQQQREHHKQFHHNLQMQLIQLNQQKQQQSQQFLERRFPQQQQQQQTTTQTVQQHQSQKPQPTTTIQSSNVNYGQPTTTKIKQESLERQTEQLTIHDKDDGNENTVLYSGHDNTTIENANQLDRLRAKEQSGTISSRRVFATKTDVTTLQITSDGKNIKHDKQPPSCVNIDMVGLPARIIGDTVINGKTQSPWCTLYIYEESKRVDKPIEVFHSEFHVNSLPGALPENNYSFFARPFKKFNNAARARKQIDKGFTITRDADGNTRLRVLSEDAAFFVQCPATSSWSRNSDGSSVYKLKKKNEEGTNQEMEIHNEKRFKEEVDSATAQNILINSSMTQIRVSLIKGFGKDYPRKTAFHCPGWILIDMNFSLFYIDEASRIIARNSGISNEGNSRN